MASLLEIKRVNIKIRTKAKLFEILKFCKQYLCSYLFFTQVSIFVWYQKLSF